MCISMHQKRISNHKLSALMFENKEIKAAMFFAIKSIS